MKVNPYLSLEKINPGGVPHDWWSFPNITESMPNVMRENYCSMIVEDKVIFLLSAMHCRYTKEWANLYRSIVIFVDKMYSERSAKYKALEAP